MQVEPEAEPGHYSVSGTASLPQGTQIYVVAVRYLHLQRSPLLVAKPTFSLLAYTAVEVDNNRWQSHLSLWQVAPDGRYLEAWQIDQPSLKLAVKPDNQVLFLATLAPLEDLEAIEQILANRNQQFASRFIHTTQDAQRYLKIAQTLDIDLPFGATQPVAVRPEDINGGWGNRFLQLPDTPNTRQFEFPQQRQTNAPTDSREFLY
ncbi:MAG: hypothetical protein HC873_02285 [Leptolyngbyaceae cyanobacterium SL_1_1]|nr:hypothetical protein [Leptolyngbyaceae cyanobacterium RM1_1_2]NJO08659.1 hypothetical protein [Leptolyngbyaceae cyanobacterium SL_1_1]